MDYLFNMVGYGDTITYRPGTDVIADLISGKIVAVLKNEDGDNLELIIQTGKNQFRQISKFDNGYIVSRIGYDQKYRYDIRENKSTEIRIDAAAAEEEHAANKRWLSRMFTFDAKGNSTPIKLNSIRDKVVELAHSNLYNTVWVDWADFLSIRNTLSNFELVSATDKKIVLSFNLGEKIEIYSFSKGDSSCYRQVFLSDYQTVKDAELDRLKNPGRRINYSDIVTKLDVERITKVLETLHDVPLKPEIRIVAGSGLTPSSDAISYSNASPHFTVTPGAAVISSGTVTLSGEVTVPSGTLSSDTFTYTIPEPKPVVYTVPSFITPPVDLPFPNITIPDFTETIGKFVDGLGRLADAFFEDTTKKEPTEMSKKHTIYSRAFKGAYSGLRHLWVNPQDYCDEFVSKGQVLAITGYENIYGEDGDYRIVHWSSSIPPGFIYFSYSDKTPTDSEIEKQSGNLLDIQAGSSISVAETLSRFKKAHKAFENAPAPKSIVDHLTADITAKENARLLKELEEANEALGLVDKANASLNFLEKLQGFEKVSPEKNMAERKAYVKASGVSSTDVVAVLREEMGKYFTEVKNLTAKSDVKPIDQPMDSAFLNIGCDRIVFKNYLRHDRILNIHEELIAPYTITALDFDRLLDEGLKEARNLSGLPDLVVEHKSPKDPDNLSNASYSAWNATVVYSSILNAFSTMDVFQTEKGREQLARWSLKWNAMHFHLQSCALDGQPNLVEIFGRDARNRVRKILDLPPNNLTFADEESLMEMKMSDSFKDAPVEAEEVAMSKSIVEDITDTYDKAKWRVAQRQLIKRLRDALILAISQFGHDRSEVKLIEKALKTQLGEGVLALAIGFIGSRVDFLASDPRAAKVLDESKIEGMAAIGDDVIERVATQVAPMVMAALSSSLDALPEIRVEVKDKPKKVRIKSKSKAEEEDEAIQEHEAEEEKTSAKRASASR